MSESDTKPFINFLRIRNKFSHNNYSNTYVYPILFQINGEIRLSCTSDLNEKIFPIDAVVYSIFQGVLLTISLVLAFQTRNVTIKAFKESRQISFAIFVTFVSVLLAIPITIAVVLPEDIASGLLGAAYIFGTVTVECAIFLPKVS